ncbi:hypothetical protein V8F20_011624 [Naviculisporaceae sp. PSN 640]
MRTVVKRNPGCLFDAIGTRHGRPHRCLLKQAIPIGNSLVPSTSCRASSLILLSHHSHPSSPSILLFRHNFKTLSPVSSQIENTSTRTSTEKMDPDAAPMGTINPPLGYETWYPTIVALRTAVNAAFPSSPRPTPTSTKEEITAFNTYWRRVFEDLHKQVESDDSIPKFLSTPPIKKFEIIIFTENNGLDCPCCLQDISPANIILENKDGLTKGDLILGLSKYLYGLDLNLDPTSPLSVTTSGGVDDEVGHLLPVIYSEYEITIKPAYPPYLVKGGDRERTLKQELANERRPLGGWPGGGGGSPSDSDLDSTSQVEEQVQKGEVDEEIKRETPDRRQERSKNEEQADVAHVVENVRGGGNTEIPVEFGEDAPAVYKFPAIIYDYSWMNGCGEGPHGEKEIYEHWQGQDMPPVARIWLFACPPESFEERVEKARQGQENEDRFYNAAEGKEIVGKGN